MSTIKKRLNRVTLLLLVIFPGTLLAQDELGETRKAQLTHIVKQDCGSCHGMTLKGGLGSPLLPDELMDKPVEMLSATIIHGRPGTAMPPFKAILTPAEAQWVAVQLKKGSFK